MTPNKQFLKAQAEQLLTLAQQTASVRQSLTATAESLYGSEGSWIAGGFKEHWPAEVKDIIRSYARQFGPLTDQSLALWRKAGCRRATWLRKKGELGIYHY